MLYLLDAEFRTVCLIGEYRSFRWNRRFDRVGDYELVLPVSLLGKVREARYLLHPLSGEIGLVREITVEKKGNRRDVTVRGGLAEALLYDRVIGEELTLDGGLEDEVLRAVREIAMTGSRAIPGLIGTEEIGAAGTVTAQAFGETLGAFLYGLLVPRGYSPCLRFDGESGFVFSLRSGVDRTGEDAEVSAAVFSSSFENLDTLRYEDKSGGSANYAYVAGALSDGVREVVEVDRVPFGEERREMWVSAYDLRRTADMSEAKYRAALRQRGDAALAKQARGGMVTGRGSGRGALVYRKHYDLGDLVCVEDRETGVSAYLRILGVTETGVYDEGVPQLLFGAAGVLSDA